MQARPNILWIVTTQWRAQACGYAGDSNARTPVLDALAAESVNYAQAVTPHPFGPFARAAMLTGVRSPQNGVRDYFDPLPVWRGEKFGVGLLQGVSASSNLGGHRSSLPLGRTIAHEMKDRGYATAFFGKWHLARRDPNAPLVGEVHAKTLVPPEARGGFEFWEGFESGFLLNDPWLHGSRLPEPVKFKGYQADVISARAAAWLQEQISDTKSQTPTTAAQTSDFAFRKPGGSSSWFAVVSFESPHPPYDAPAAGVNVRDPHELVLPANVSRGGEIEAKARRELAGYYTHIEATDRAVGRLLASVDATTSIVVFTSVHGDMHGAHGLFRKGWPQEESVRVPLLVRGARERVPSGEWQARSGVSEAAVSLVDLPAMTLAWAEGRTAVIDGRYSGISMPSVVALPHQCDRVWRGVRTAKRKLVLNDDGSPWLFFDLEKDPLEMNNLVGDFARVEEMEELRRRVMES